jgi:hypothetical protein
MRQKLKYLNFNQLLGESYGSMKEDRFTGPLFLLYYSSFKLELYSYYNTNIW